jgi:predicted neutral ceramidase superfamily lipid hydrolase
LLLLPALVLWLLIVLLCRPDLVVRLLLLLGLIFLVALLVILRENRNSYSKHE